MRCLIALCALAGAVIKLEAMNYGTRQISSAQLLKIFLYATQPNKALLDQYEAGKPTIFWDLEEYRLQAKTDFPLNNVAHQYRYQYNYFSAGVPKQQFFSGHFGPIVKQLLCIDPYKNKGPITAAQDNSIRIWTSGSNNSIILTGHQATITELINSPDDHYIVSGSADGKLIFWDTVRLKAVVGSGHQRAITSITSIFLSKDKSLCETKSAEGTLSWAIDNTRGKLEVNPFEPCQSVEYPIASSTLATDTENQKENQDWLKQENPLSCTHLPVVVQKCIVDYLSGMTLTKKWLGKGIAQVLQFKNQFLSVQPGGSATYDRTLRVSSDFYNVTGCSHKTVMAFHGDTIATARGAAIQLLSKDGKQEVLSIGLQKNIAKIAFSPDGLYLALGCEDGAVSILDVKSQNNIKLTGHKQAIKDLKFSYNNKVLFSHSADNTVKYWNGKTGKFLHQISVPACEASAFSEDGKFLALIKDGNSLDVIDLLTNKIVFNYINLLNLNDVVLKFGRNKKLYNLCNHDSSIRIMDLSSGKIEQILPHQTIPLSPNGFSVSENGQYIAAGSFEGVVYTWQTEGAQLWEFIEAERVLHKKSGKKKDN